MTQKLLDMNAKVLIGGFIVGVAVGAAAGPVNGAKARKRLVKGTMKVKSNVVDYMESALDTLSEQFNERLTRLIGGGKTNVTHGNHVTERINEAV